MPTILSKKFTITNPQEQASNIDDMFDDLYRQIFDGMGTRLDEGDVVVADADGNFDGVSLGTVGAFLRAGSSAPAWSTLILPNAATLGDIPYASAANILSMLADVATGNALLSGGVGVAPSWGKIGLTTHVSGILPVANGGTGRASHTAYAVLCGGTTSTGAQQSVAALGSSGQVLMSNGAAALPSFQTLSATPTVQATAVTGAQANFELSAAYTYLRCTNATTVTFSGFTGPAGNVFDGYMAIINATGAGNVVILDQGVGSSSFYRVRTPASSTITLTTGEQAIMVYEESTAKWHCAAIGMVDPLPVLKGGTGTGTAFTASRIVFAGASGVYSQNAALSFDTVEPGFLLNGAALRIADAGVGNIYFSKAGRGITFVTTPLSDAFNANQTILGNNNGGIEFNTVGDSVFIIGNTTTSTTKPMLDIRAYDAATSNAGLLALQIRSVPAGTAAVGFGTKFLFKANSTTTADQDQATLETIWTTATHASRTSAVVLKTVNNAAALAEIARFSALGITGYEFYLTSNVYLLRSTATMGDGAGALVGTLTNSPVTGNPTKWLKFDDNGTPRYIPAW